MARYSSIISLAPSTLKQQMVFYSFWFYLTMCLYSQIFCWCYVDNTQLIFLFSLRNSHFHLDLSVFGRHLILNQQKLNVSKIKLLFITGDSSLWSGPCDLSWQQSGHSFSYWMTAAFFTFIMYGFSYGSVVNQMFNDSG